VPHRSANAIRARVATADHNHVFAFRGHELAVPDRAQVALGGDQEALLVRSQELHRVVHPFGFAAFDSQVPRLRSAHGQHRRVAVVFEHFYVHVFANVRVGHELNAFFSQQVHPPLDRALVELHVWDAVHEQAPNPVVALVHGDFVAQLVQLVGCG
jgi:hypothetical protein